MVARTDEIRPGQRKIVEVSGRSIGVFNVGGEFFALRNRCPHQGGPLCQGRLSGFLEADVPGEYRFGRQGEILRCPWHGWEFDVRNGQSWFDPRHTRVRGYEVTVETGSHLIDDTDQDGQPRPGPYLAETYPVTVEERYVIVEMGD